MNFSFVRSVAMAALGLVSMPALAQMPPLSGQPAPAQDNNAQEASSQDGEGEIVVTGQRQVGSVIGDIQPELQLGVQDIRAIGASSLAELLAELAPQTRSGRGRSNGPPAVLLNGKRVSGFAEICNIPPEAIIRVDVLPEEVALKYGFRADQRVINFVLRPRFKAVTGELEVGGPTDGGRFSNEIEANFLKLNKDSRISLEAKSNIDTLVTENERRIVSPTQLRAFDLAGNITAPIAGAAIDPALSALAGSTVTIAAVPATASSRAPLLAEFAGGGVNVTDIRPFRSLLPDTRTVSLNGTLAGSILGDVAATLTGGIERTTTEALQGLAPVTLTLPAGNPFSPFAGDVVLGRYGADPLQRNGTSWNSRLGTVLDGRISGWRWNLTGNWLHAQSQTRIDRGLDVSTITSRLAAGDPALNPYGDILSTLPRLTDVASTNSDTASLDLLVSGSPFSLPAGRAGLSVKAQVQTLALDTRSVRAGLVQAADLARTQGNFQANIDLPIASIDALAALGKLTLNGNIALDSLSDFGTLVTWGTGFNWTPIEQLEIITSFTREQGAPGVGQLGDPQIATPGVRVFDFVRGETVDITRIDGGNAALVADSRRVFKLGLNAKPLAKVDLVLNGNFTASRIDNPIAAFPTATAELEAAFPDRFRRGTDGRLFQIDNRPVNFASSARQELRWGFTLTQTLKPGAAERAAVEKRIAEGRAAFAARAAEAARTGQPAPTPAFRTPFGGPPGGGQPGGGRPGGGFGGFGGGGRGGPPGGFLDGRVQLALFHTVRFQDEILIRPGLPVLDLLNGSAVGSRGGQPRHEVEMRLGAGRRGLGARVSVNWQSATQVLVDPTGGTQSPDDLRFSDLTTVNLRLFVDLGQRPEVLRKAPWLRGSRISLSVNNLLNDRINVRSRAGLEPIGFQRDQIDPLGRTVTLSLRKLFF
ncbi:TonB-dependent receptor [Sandarakinorhabdus sp.]|uniref:TonB-dependent receptor n=1 Tax=Sandarakinorhabdus sp. TaxID=1916663 RepID=UPI00286E9EE0|nr:TonB-dependent receptor [Sandarakinorhabdus sp.]